MSLDQLPEGGRCEVGEGAGKFSVEEEAGVIEDKLETLELFGRFKIAIGLPAPANGNRLRGLANRPRAEARVP